MAEVGTGIRIDLLGTSKTGGQLTYAYRAADLNDLDGHADITVLPSGAGVFRWTPLAADLGIHAFDFTVSDDSESTTVRIQIDVRSAIGSATAPVFRQPLGTGTTVDLAKTDCVDLDIVVDDEDSPVIAIRQEAPVLDGMRLVDSTGKKDCPPGGCLGGTAKWHWCPSPAQATTMVNTVVLSADDGDNPQTLKTYMVVLHGTPSTPPPTCVDDAHEHDDTFAQARQTYYPSWTSTANQICPNNDDHYRVTLFAGEILTVDLTFTESDASGDLDLHLYENGIDLWPCDPDHLDSCSIEHGQSASSNEHATFVMGNGCSAGCDYDLVVRGFNGASNAYAIRIAID